MRPPWGQYQLRSRDMIKSLNLHRAHRCQNDSHGERLFAKNETKFIVAEVVRMSNFSTQNPEGSIHLPAFWVQ